ncbi:MAG: hypothetical protein JWP91_3376 [Fibrobacteres bacterium]|nr:hypothetical protein [Fibrobacterota bacterium]
MKIPMNLLVFVAVAGVFYLYILPKKNQYVSGLMKSMGAGGPVSREDSVKAMVEARIIVDLCPRADLSEYRPRSWSDYGAVDDATSSIVHEFSCDGANRKFLFRLRYGSITEIVDLN